MTAHELPSVVDWLRKRPDFNCLPDTLIPGTLMLYPSSPGAGIVLKPSAHFWCVRYLLKQSFTQNYLSVTSGKAKAGDFYLDTGYYVLGTTPYPGPPNSRIVFRFDKDLADWYIQDVSANYVRPEDRHKNVFGPHWILRRWHHNELTIRIDDHSPRKERRTIKFQQRLSRQDIVT